MKRRFYSLIAVLFFCQFLQLKAQSGLDLCINEVLVVNDSNYVDDFGMRSAWIEIFNKAYNSVNMAGMYLTDDSAQPTKYLIPKGDPVTLIAPRNYLVFFADNRPTRGILHLNFELRPTGSYLALYDVNGRTLIDKVKLSAGRPDVSVGREQDGTESWMFLDKTTPKANNFTGVVITSGEKFVKLDPYGIGMAVIAMSVVFSALILLYLVFKNTRRLYTLNVKKLFTREKAMKELNELHDISGEVNAAISMALYLYHSELHDVEETVLTIKKVARTYSPWSSKIYGLRNPQR